MNDATLRSEDPLTHTKVFRVASLALYAVLLIQVALELSARGVALTQTLAVTLGLLSVLFLLSLSRCIWPSAALYGKPHMLYELGATLLTIVLLMQQQSLPTTPLTWLVGVAGVFPLAFGFGTGLSVVVVVAATSVSINATISAPSLDWFAEFAATGFVGLLAVILTRALDSSLNAMRKSRHNERRFDAIARTTRNMYIITDTTFHIKYANPAMYDIIGYTADEIERDLVSPVLHPEDIDAHRSKLRFLRATPNSSIFSRHRTQHKAGHWVWLETSGYNMQHDPDINGLIFSVDDVSARMNVEMKLAQEHTLLRAVLDLNPDMIYAKDNAGRFTVTNQSFQTQFGFTSEDALRGKTSYELFLAHAHDDKKNQAYDQADQLHRQDLHVIETGTAAQTTEVQGLWLSDSRQWYRTFKYPLLDANANAVGVLGIARDITDSKEYETRLEHQALHDPLTGLPSRRYLLKRLAESMADSRTTGTDLVMLFCDLDFFKSVNDTHGHDFGDKCLLELTRRILAELPTLDFVARFGGDEFVVISTASVPDAVTKAEVLLRAITQPLQIQDVIVKVQASIGIALLHPEHKSPSDLIRDADAAMYQAKERGRDRIEIFDAALQNTTNKRAQMNVALRFALERNELAVVYQPKVSIIDGTVQGFELLVRWHSPQFGHISPDEFIPIAEESGLVVPIGLWVLEQACRQLSAWQSRIPDLHHLTIAVNVSMRQLLQSSFLSDVTAILHNTHTLPQSIELELTESSAMANPAQTIETMSMLKQLGLRLALDDFGTGYSSLAYLQKLPIDVLKIDKAFVQGLGTSAEDAEIVKLILALAHTLNIETIAEGVETESHLLALRQMGCSMAQGFLFSQPVTADEAEQLLQSTQCYSIA